MASTHGAIVASIGSQLEHALKVFGQTLGAARSYKLRASANNDCGWLADNWTEHAPSH
jgi:hypothetical protein